MKCKQFKLRNLFLIIIIVSIQPLQVFSQDLTGMWTGKIFTTDKTLPYEVAISEKDGKLSGFSYTTFTVKGEEMVAMKSIIVKQEKGKVIIEDADLVFNSFDEESPKQLKQTNTMELEVDGKTMILYGKFQTLKTKQFRSMTGGVRLRKDSIIQQPKLIAKLDEMELSKSLSFIPKPETANEDVAKEDEATKISKTETVTTKTKQNEKSPAVAKVTTSKIARQQAKPIATISKVSPVTANNTATAKPPVAIAKPAPAKPATTTPVVTAPATVAVAKKPEPKRAASNAFATTFGDRTLETIQTVVFKSDSLKLTLYDNGEVDGDTVSIFLNGKVILSKQGLSTNAINKTIYLPPEMGDSLQLVMYAENLGSIPPNTGLLIIKDGRDRYEIRFSGDLKKNAAIVLRRRHDE